MANQQIKVVINGEEYVAKPANNAANSLNNVASGARNANAALSQMNAASQGAAAGLGQMTIGGYTLANIMGNVLTGAANKAMSAVTNLAHECTTAGAEWSEAIQDITNKTGMSAEEASKLAGVSSIVGISAKDLGSSLSIMNRKASDAADAIRKAEAAGKGSTDVFTKWGIAVVDENNNLLSTQQILQNIITRHRDMANGVQKTAMEMEIMGRSGTRMNEFLNLSAEEMAEYTRNVERAGLVMNNETIEAFEQVGRKTNVLNECFQGLYTSTNAALLPALTELTDDAVKLTQEFVSGTGTGGAFKDVIVNIADSIAGAITAYTNLDDSTKSLIGSTAEVTAGVGAFGVGLSVSIVAMASVVEAIGTLISTLSELKKAYDLVAIAKAGALGGGVALLGAGVAYGGIQIGKALSGDDGKAALNWNANMMFGEAGTSGMEKSTKIDVPTKSYAELLDADSKEYSAETKINRLKEQIGKVGETAATAANQISGAGQKAESVVVPMVNNAVDAFRSLKDTEKYVIDGGTGCMDACSKALRSIGASEKLFEANAYGDAAINVEAFYKNAEKYGLIHANNGTYSPRGGDIAIYVDENGEIKHAAMVTESGGTIQNGESEAKRRNGYGVYERDESPEYFGNVAYYAKTSDFTSMVKEGSAGINSKALANQAIAQKAQAISQYQSLLKNIDSATNSMSGGSASIKILDEAKTKLIEINTEIAKAKAHGIDTKELETKGMAYMDAMKERAIRAKREETDEKYQLELDHISRMTDLNQGYAADMTAAYIPQLNAYKDFLQQQLALTSLNNQERARMEQSLADTMSKINEQQSYDMRTAWGVALKEMANRQINYKESIVGVFDNIEQAGVTLLSSTESIGTKAANFFQSIAQNILETMAKIIMQGLITNTVMSIFGMGSSGNPFTSSNWGKMSGSGFLPMFASGGDFAPGVALVGENGPELVRFGTTGHVYNNTETNRMLGGQNPVSLKLDIKNESGTPVQAEQTGTSFNGEEYIVGVVLKAVSTNKSNIRGILKGAVATS